MHAIAAVATFVACQKEGENIKQKQIADACMQLTTRVHSPGPRFKTHDENIHVERSVRSKFE